jgi:hypothetical protein
MTRFPRRVALVLLTLGLVFALAAPLGAASRQDPPAGWLAAVQQLAGWVASWWAPPPPARHQSRGPAASNHGAKVRTDCGPEIDPDGHCA